MEGSPPAPRDSREKQKNDSEVATPLAGDGADEHRVHGHSVRPGRAHCLLNHRNSHGRVGRRDTGRQRGREEHRHRRRVHRDDERTGRVYHSCDRSRYLQRHRDPLRVQDRRRQ